MGTTPFIRYSGILGPKTLANRIRESTWEIKDLIPETDKDFKEIKENIELLGKGKTRDVAYKKLKSSIPKLSSELKEWMVDLKLINFYDSAILYLYSKYLTMLYLECRKRIKIKLPRKKKKEMKERPRKVEKEMKKMLKVKGKLLGAVKELKVEANKELSHHLHLSHLMAKLRRLKKLNRHIKIEANRIKRYEDERKNLMDSLSSMDEKKVKETLQIIEEVIKDVEECAGCANDEIVKLEAQVSKLKPMIKQIKRIVKKDEYVQLFKTSLHNLEAGIHEDLREIHGNALSELNTIASKQ